jgi:WD40 repeat protein
MYALDESLSLDAMRRIDAICRRYEQAWKSGSRPVSASYLAEAAPADAAGLARELAALDAYYEETLATQPLATTQPQNHRAALPGAAGIPGYELLRELGRGGMGVVYLARQTNLKRIVALKMILTGGQATVEELERFRSEANAIARVQHSHIVQIHEIGEQGGLPFFSMELCPGGGLDAKLAGTPMAPGEAAALLAPLARAIHAAHAKGVLHRDLKPANVLLAEDGTPKITDFGLARSLGDTVRTTTGAILGTPSYMSPEQAGGKSKEIGPACDIYALGAILYECLTGRPPFKAATPMDTLLQVMNEEPVAPRRLNAQVPVDVETICMKCLQKAPDKRYATAHALAEDLERFQRGDAIHARPIGRGERAARWCRRNPFVATTSAAAILILALSAVGAAVAAMLLNDERLTAEANAKKANDNLTRALIAERENAEKLRESYYAQAQALRWSGQAGRRDQSLLALKKAAAIRPSLELRNEAMACMALFDLRVAKEWDGCPGPVGEIPQLVFDEQLQHYARADARGNISIRRVADDREIRSLQGLPGKVAATMIFRPDGKQLAVSYCPAGQTENNVVCLWDVSSGRKVLHLERHMHRRAWAFSRDGAILALGCQDRTVRFFSTEKGDEIGRHTYEQIVLSIHFHPDEKILAIRHERAVRLQDRTTGNTLRLLPTEGLALDLAWHPSGDMLAGAVDDRIYLWNARTGAVVRTLEGHPDSTVTMLAFSQAGDVLASTGWDSVVKLWQPATGGLILRVDHVDLRTWGPGLQFSRDDQLLAYNIRGAKLQLWEVQRSQECVQLFGTGQRDADIHPDGRLAAVADTKGVRIWDLDRGEQLGFHALPDSHSVMFHPDGKSLITSGQAAGLQRWPMRTEPGSSLVRIGPPQSLWRSGNGEASLAWDGKRIAVASHAGHGAVLDLDSPKDHVPFKSQTRMMHVAISPDGRWVATGAWAATGVKIWDAKTGDLVRDLPGTLYSARVQFSPDSRWLVTGVSDEYCFWEVDGWKLIRRHARTRSGMSGPMAFSPDGAIAAIASSPNTIQLIDVAEGHELATLTPADARNFEGLRFSRDGSRLAVSAHGVLQVWNLRLLRVGLAELGLDWSSPAYAPAREPAGAAALLKVEFVRNFKLQKVAP